MANYNWKSGVNGDWGTAGNWQQDAVPDSTIANATIASTTDIGVTLAAGQSFSVDSVTLGSSTVTLDVAGLLQLGGDVDELVLNTGTLNLEAGGTLANGTIIAGAGAVNFGTGATLDDITYIGALNLTAAGTTLSIANGLTVEDAGGGAGTINLSGAKEKLIFTNDTTLQNIGINLGAGGTGQSGTDGIIARGASVLTLGAGTTITANSSSLDTYFYEPSSLSGHAIINDGMINVISGTLAIDPSTFMNSGTIDVSAGAAVIIGAGDIGSAGTIVGAGQVFLEGNHTIADLSGISLSGNGLLDISGGFNLDGGTLAVGYSNHLEIGGHATLSNGTIIAGSGLQFLDYSGYTNSGPTLTNITWIGDMNIGGTVIESGGLRTIVERVTIAGAFDMVSASGHGRPWINVAFECSLDFTESQETLSNIGIRLGTPNGENQFAELQSAYGAGDELVFGKKTVVDSYQYRMDSNLMFGQKIVNDGVINVKAGILGINGDTFTNAGTIDVSGGHSSDLVLESGLISNTGLLEGTGAGFEYVNVTTNVTASKKSFEGTTLTGGTLEANPGNTMLLDLEGRLINTDDGTLILNGAGSEIEERNAPSTETGTYISLENTLTTIGSGGMLEVLGGRGYTTSNTLMVDGGRILFDGGVFNAALELGAPNSDFTGFGTIAGATGNSGVIEAAGGTLIIDGPLIGSGTLQIDAGAALELSSGTSETVSFAGAGSRLILEAPTLFTGTLSGIAAGDSIDLAGETASSARISGTSLLVTLTSHAVLDYTLASALPMEGVSISNSGSGVELTFYQLPAAAAAPAMRFMEPSAVAGKPAHSRQASLPPLQDLWSASAATHYRPFFTGYLAHASATNPQHLQAELSNMPTPANAGIVLSGLQSGGVAHIFNHDLPFAPLRGFL